MIWEKYTDLMIGIMIEVPRKSNTKHAGSFGSHACQVNSGELDVCFETLWVTSFGFLHPKKP